MGLFELTLSSGETVNFEGGFHFVRDQDDDVRQVVLLANDVTKVQQAIAVSEAARKETAQAQKQVVDALKMGLDRLADGELTVRLHEPFHEDYEMLRDNFNRTCETLMNAIAGVGENAETIRGEAAEISSAADSLSQRTERQAASLEETAAALDELTTSVASAAQGAKRPAMWLLRHVQTLKKAVRWFNKLSSRWVKLKVHRVKFRKSAE